MIRIYIYKECNKNWLSVSYFILNTLNTVYCIQGEAYPVNYNLKNNFQCAWRFNVRF